MQKANNQRTCLAIVLAAGEGTRMKSRLPKVMHAIAGRSLIAHVLDAVSRAGAREIAVVTAARNGPVTEEARRIIPNAIICEQRERRGTAHAVLAARGAIERGANDILVVFGDTPLIRPGTLASLRTALADGAAVAVLGFRPADPKGYGRLVVANGELA
ncbi:MAG: NTP transferase domain-containing protein, partial [Acidobacteriota bacterium]